jgi:hypothetical protein
LDRASHFEDKSPPLRASLGGYDLCDRLPVCTARSPIHATAKALKALRWRRFPEAENAWLGGQSFIWAAARSILTVTAVL